jgi:predicted HTH transcriptional regulator
MTRILEAYDRSILKLTPGFTIVTFPFAEPFITPNDKKSGKINGKIKEDADPIIEALISDPTSTIPELSDSTGISQRTVSRRLHEYQGAGILRREGARKNGKWVIDTPMYLEAKRFKKRY